MSSLIVDVCAVEEIRPHGNAERLELTRVKNWWCVTGKGQYNVGDKVVYVPPDAVLPEALAERWGIAKYCSPLPTDISGIKPPGLRVRACRLRGTPSFGTLQNPDDATWEVGTDVREFYGITKFEPPVKSLDGDAAPEVPAFHAYTGIENIRNFPGVLKDGEDVVVTEKIHGSNSRVGLVYHTGDDGQPDWVFMAGSHGTRRKERNDKGTRSKYWFPFKDQAEGDAPAPCPLRNMLLVIAKERLAERSVIAFGEIFGPGMQDMHYGQKGLAYRIFDICVDGVYLDTDVFLSYMRAYHDSGLLAVPILYTGPFSMAKMEELVDGHTTVCDASDINQPFKGREGIVIKPVKERNDPILGGPCGGRVILKSVSVDYHERKNKNQTEDH